MAGTLYLVATPIGNLGDMTKRAAETLAAVDFIAAEDTRVTLKLLNHLGIKKPLVSYYQHNTAESGARIIGRILAGESCALTTDAGMPAISDPGEELVRLAAEAGITVIALPGPCAAVTALALSGFPTGRFTFEGFLSTARKNRFEHLQSLKNEKRTMIFYEAPHKLLSTLRDMLDVLGDRRVSISREMTKLHEETLRTTLRDAAAHFQATPPRGEFVLIIEGTKDIPVPESSMDDVLELVAGLLKNGMSLKDAAREGSKASGFTKNAIYEAALKANLQS